MRLARTPTPTAAGPHTGPTAAIRKSGMWRLSGAAPRALPPAPCAADPEVWDVAFVGGGPAGLAAARVAAAAGARTVVLERAEHPRYKTCGGGLIGASLGAAAGQIELPARDQIRSVTFTLRGGRELTRSEREPLLAMVTRA